jgi:RNA polymerase sigma factor (sigma-70 family)
MDQAEASEAQLPLTQEVVARLLANHRQFLKFLEARLPSRAVAEEVLQSAFVRAIERGGVLRETESAVAWFYRLLRNALVDQYRHTGSEARALEVEAREAAGTVEPELRDAVCACMNQLLPTLKPEYAEIVRRVDLEETPVADVATALSITTNNATVRLHRARRALKERLERSCGTCATHGCLDCTCGTPGGGCA